MDIIYRDMKEFEAGISSVVDNCTPWNGYTTCMWHNLITSKIVLDKDGKLHELQEKYKIPYPQKLKENIISNNLKLLNGMLPSFDVQIKKAESRKIPKTPEGEAGQDQTSGKEAADCRV